MVESIRTTTVGTLGMLGTISLGQINMVVGILCGLTTLVYLFLKIAILVKELRTK
jgi:hypothetical protein